MDRSFSNQLDVPEDHAAIRDGVRAVVTRFDDEYWLARDEDGKFPFESPCRNHMAAQASGSPKPRS
jgi:acyl-CoA dehydrogenase